MIQVRSSVKADAQLLVEDLRAQDKLEVTARFGRPPQQVILAAVLDENQRTYSIVDKKGGVLGIFGIGHSQSTPFVGHPWLLGTTALFSNNSRQFISETKPWIRKLSEGYLTLENFILAENTVHINWIEHHGFKVSPRKYYFANKNHPFYRFEISVKQISK